jgi:DNA-directed RNA polymerase specialized sigma24 family protein
MRGTRAGESGGQPDGSDFADYVRLHSPALLRTAFLLTGDPGLAEDLLQTALARVYPRWHRLDHLHGNVNAYVLRTLRT